MTNYLGITIDDERDNRLSDQAIKLMQDYYMLDHENSPQEAFARASVAYCGNDLDLAQRIYDYASKGWFMFASPVLSNAPEPNGKISGLPISCFLTYVGDTLDSLIEHNGEVAWLSVKGGGVGGHWSDVRGISDKAPGPIPFMKVVDAQMTAYKQGKTRKGSYAAYLDVSHPDIEEFVSFKVPTGGDINRKCFNLFNAVNITDEFMESVINDAEWNLTETSATKSISQQVKNVQQSVASPQSTLKSTTTGKQAEWLETLSDSWTTSFNSLLTTHQKNYQKLSTQLIENAQSALEQWGSTDTSKAKA
jgi:ribonucleoside-diphosphate reductase alpha chain